VGRASGIRERRRYSSEFELEAPQLRAALESSAQPLLITDPLDRVAFANVAAQQLLGSTDSPLQQSDLDRHLFALDGSRALPEGALELVTYGACSRKLALADGRVVHATFTPLPDRWGQAAHVAIGLEPIERAAASEATLDAFGRLAGELAHDINNQLSAALNYVFILRRRLGRTSPWASHLDELQAAAWHAAALTGGLRLIGRARTSEPECVVFSEIVQRTEPLLRHLARGVQLEVEIEPDLPDVCAPIAYVEQVLVMTTVYGLARTAFDGRLKLSACSHQPVRGAARSTRWTCEPESAVAVMPVPSLASMSHTNGVLRRALKRCAARVGHDSDRVWVDFRNAEAREHARTAAPRAAAAAWHKGRDPRSAS
jgi:nitrogen-specific signal transduction histidine kinase